MLPLEQCFMAHHRLQINALPRDTPSPVGPIGLHPPITYMISRVRCNPFKINTVDTETWSGILGYKEKLNMKELLGTDALLECAVPYSVLWKHFFLQVDTYRHSSSHFLPSFALFGYDVHEIVERCVSGGS
jgi:hypothetical protein